MECSQCPLVDTDSITPLPIYWVILVNMAIVTCASMMASFVHHLQTTVTNGDCAAGSYSAVVHGLSGKHVRLQHLNNLFNDFGKYSLCKPHR